MKVFTTMFPKAMETPIALKHKTFSFLIGARRFRSYLCSLDVVRLNLPFLGLISVQR